MNTATISVEVDSETARAYEAATPEERRKMQGWLNRQLNNYISRPQQTLDAIMDEMSRQAEANGLTPEILERILNDE